MGEKALEVYQGSDWMTYHWPVAQAFETLDRIRDLCSSTPAVLSALPQIPGMLLPRHEMFDENITDIFGTILELCDDLMGELDAAQASLSHQAQIDVRHRWMGFEMSLNLKEMRQEALCEHQALEPSSASLDTINTYVTRIRELLKQIDQ